MREIANLATWVLHFLRHGKQKKHCLEGKKIVLVGNGPSAKDFTMYRFKEKGYEFCCVNFFSLTEDVFFKLKPEYYCYIDPAFIRKGDAQDERVIKLVEIFQKVDWNIKIITYPGFTLQINNKHISYLYLNHNNFEGKITKIKRFLFNSNSACPILTNVSAAALFFFVISKCERIILTGVDLSTFQDIHVDQYNRVFCINHHFYGDERKYLDEGAIPVGRLYEWFYYNYLAFWGFAIISKLAKANGVKIYNTSIESYVDVFEKCEAEALIQCR